MHSRTTNLDGEAIVASFSGNDAIHPRSLRHGLGIEELYLQQHLLHLMRQGRRTESDVLVRIRDVQIGDPEVE